MTTPYRTRDLQPSRPEVIALWRIRPFTFVLGLCLVGVISLNVIAALGSLGASRTKLPCERVGQVSCTVTKDLMGLEIEHKTFAVSRVTLDARSRGAPLRLNLCDTTCTSFYPSEFDQEPKAVLDEARAFLEADGRGRITLFTHAPDPGMATMVCLLAALPLLGGYLLFPRRVRIAYDGESRELWIAGSPAAPIDIDDLATVRVAATTPRRADVELVGIDGRSLLLGLRWHTSASAGDIVQVIEQAVAAWRR